MPRPADNPFASHRLEAIEFEPQGMTWDQIDARLDELRYRACIMGEQGSGKTTLLEALARRLDRQGWRTHLLLHSAVAPDIPWLRCLGWGRRDIVLLDGADLLDRGRWRLLLAISMRWRGLIVVSHHRALLGELMTCRTDARLLETLICGLVPDGAGRSELAVTLHEKHGGNIREALREGYDLWQSGRLG